MDKRGAIITLDELASFIPKIMVALIGVFILFTLWSAFFTEKISAGQYDLIRVYRNIQDLAPRESFTVFTAGKDYYFVLIPKANNPEPACANNACICVQEKTSGTTYTTTKCEIFTNDDCTKAQSDPRFICISTNIKIPVSNVRSKDYVKISRSATGEIAIALNKITI